MLHDDEKCNCSKTTATAANHHHGNYSYLTTPAKKECAGANDVMEH